MEPEPFDAEECVWSCRYAHKSGDTDRATVLREQWAHWQGEDSLQEKAFGAPIDRKALDERIGKLMTRHDRVPDRWPATFRETKVSDSGKTIRRNCIFGDSENEDTREARAISKESRAIKKEFIWLMRYGSELLQNIAE